MSLYGTKGENDLLIEGAKTDLVTLVNQPAEERTRPLLL